MDTMPRIGSLLATSRTPTPAEKAVIAQVHELVRAWLDGVSIDDVRLVSTGHELFTATRFTDLHHSLWQPLMRMLDALIAADTSNPYGRMYQTPQGTFTEAELRAVGARISMTAGGRIRILFPVRHPWRIKPDRDRGIEGVPADPLYAETYQERNRFANEKQAPTAPRRYFD